MDRIEVVYYSVEGKSYGVTYHARKSEAEVAALTSQDAKVITHVLHVSPDSIAAILNRAVNRVDDPRPKED